MRIAIIGANTFDSLEYNLEETFRHRGEECRIFDIYDGGGWKRNKVIRKLDWLGRQWAEPYDRRVFRILFRKMTTYRPDLIIGVYRFIHPDFVKAVRAISGCRIIHINPDALVNLEKQQLFVEPYDAYFTKDPFMYKFMKHQLELNVYLYNEAFNPRLHVRPCLDKAALEEEIDTDVLVFGNIYPYRNRILWNLKKKGISLSIYGKRSSYFAAELQEDFKGDYILGARKARLIYGSRVVFNNLHYAEVESVNNKFFEINGSGGFQLCDYRPILHDLLPVDPEWVSYKNVGEAAEKIRYYLDRPHERYRISGLIYDYFQQHYTYDHLIDYLFSRIG